MQRTIAFLVFDGFQNLDLAGPLAVFETGRLATKPVPYRLKILAPTGGQIVSSSTAITLAEAMETAGPIDTLIIVGGAGTRKVMEDERVLAFVRARAAKVRRVCSVCSGAFILAAAGVLNERQATTHWRYAKEMSTRFPAVSVAMEKIYVRDCKFWTSAGVTAGIDLALALVADDLGEDIARAIAQELVVYYRRPGGQSQFSALLALKSPGNRFAAVIGWIRENLDEDLTVDTLAQRASMSPRNFSRTFTREVGLPPAKAVERIRLETARARVEGTSQNFDAIATACGLHDADRMRRSFLRAFGQPPQTMRRQAAKPLS
ncbi:MAG: GlxA family transcriptional regulator [Hyphomonadaceae bacterium]